MAEGSRRRRRRRSSRSRLACVATTRTLKVSDGGLLASSAATQAECAGRMRSSGGATTTTPMRQDADELEVQRSKQAAAYTVRVRVLRASGLKPADNALKTMLKGGGLHRSSDPYVVVTCAGKHRPSAHKVATLEPEWVDDEATFSFDAATPPAEFQIAVFARDEHSSDDQLVHPTLESNSTPARTRLD